MLRRSNILTAAALALCCSLAPTAAAGGEVPPPPSSIAASQAEEYKELRSVDPAGQSQDLRSPDAQDAAAHRGITRPTRARMCSIATTARPTRSTPHGSPARADPAPVVTVTGSPSGGFDWGDAGIGAAGMLALFSIAAGSALLLAGRRRRQGVGVATQ